MKVLSRPKSVFILALLLIATVPLSGQTRSAKRGVSANSLGAEQVGYLAPGVSWLYNWGTTPGNIALDGEIEYLPMIWGANQGTLDAVKAYLDSGATPSAIMVLNEPNLRGQAFVSPEVSANWMQHVRASLGSYGIPLIGPQMALGSSVEDSITAYDPIQEKVVTYTSMDSFLDAYDYYYGAGVNEGIGVHPYGNAGELKWSVNNAYARYGKPVWVTEFAFWDASSDEAMYEYMIQVLDFMERSPKVAGYAWFKADPDYRNPALALIQPRGSQLTELGELYVNFPAYDPDYYYPVPGRIQAEAYHDRDDLALVAAESRDGMAALYVGRQSAMVSYQIAVAEAGLYALRLRISSLYYSDLPEGEADPSIIDPPTGKERDVTFEVELEAGEQVLQIMLKGLNGKVDWFELQPVSSN